MSNKDNMHMHKHICHVAEAIKPMARISKGKEAFTEENLQNLHNINKWQIADTDTKECRSLRSSIGANLVYR
jgi:hypothetical protein